MEILIRILANFVPGKKRRSRVRIFLRNYFYGFRPRKVASVGDHVNFCGPVKLTGHTKIGEGSAFRGELEISGSGDCTIGRYCHFAPNCTILTQNHSYDDGESIPYGVKNTLKPVIIGDFVWCGQNTTILPGSRIGEGAIIQAGAVVHGEIPPLAIAGGNPAVVFSHRNAEHFYELKAQGKFR